MRLLNATTKQLSEFFDDDIPPYAILSHTWGAKEMSFQDVLQMQQSANTVTPPTVHMIGCDKIDGCCARALQDGFDWVWIDTCCIDKTSSAELSEAINSMFRWYKNAEICYAYLSDVDDAEDPQSGSTFRQSRWFTRGWTLQELLAPRNVVFFSRSWAVIDNRSTLHDLIEQITGIQKDFLEGRALVEASVARKLSWASQRKTTRKEDVAYCLLGIFDVNMPLLYGEGDKAFMRLQKKIIKATNDQSILAWGLCGTLTSTARERESILATSPTDFEGCGDIVPCKTRTFNPATQFEVTKNGILIELPLIKTHILPRSNVLGLLNCRREDDFSNVITIPLGQLRHHPGGRFAMRNWDRNSQSYQIHASSGLMRWLRPEPIYITATRTSAHVDVFNLRSGMPMPEMESRIVLLEVPSTFHYCQSLVPETFELSHTVRGLILKERDSHASEAVSQTPSMVLVYRVTQTQSDVSINKTIFVKITFPPILARHPDCRLSEHDHMDAFSTVLGSSNYLENIDWKSRITLNNKQLIGYTEVISFGTRGGFRVAITNPATMFDTQRAASILTSTLSRLLLSTPIGKSVLIVFLSLFVGGLAPWVWVFGMHYWSKTCDFPLQPMLSSIIAVVFSFYLVWVKEMVGILLATFLFTYYVFVTVLVLINGPSNWPFAY